MNVEVSPAIRGRRRRRVRDGRRFIVEFFSPTHSIHWFEVGEEKKRDCLGVKSSSVVIRVLFE